jgi:hypothetical protein
MAPAELGDALHAGRNFLGRPVDELAQALDWFFDDERVEDEADGRLRLGTSLLLEPSGTSGLETDVSLSINLPNAEERLRLIVTGAVWRDDEEEELRARERPGAEEDADDAEDREDSSSFAADLRYTLREDLERHLDAKVGLRVRDFTPAGVVGLRYRRNWDPDDWSVRLTNRVEWETMRGFAADSFFDFERTLASDLFFRATPSVGWQEDQSGFAYGFGFALTQRLTKRRFLQYTLDYDFSSRHGLEQILVRARLRQTLFRDWVFGEIAPQLRYADRDGFDGTPGILFSLQAVF